ncbi:efflux transporter outer membrane subunit [Variovorax sp. OV329]|uniref:efflux transporter outer membrane subunit n=1 Tax=Variovorax sp. OV329 TaxID=1882825 RepID=UPI0008E88F8F|nr:efflux transporter outer membrane subunit [Variovorax sp. OV329]SFM62583.1 efflux transporter, outer membrane factor (OMF) lipoprotein, NodT family [Variovorax sp. OV329]
MTSLNLHRPTLLALIACALVAGCAVGPDFQAPADPAPGDFASWHGGAAELVPDAARAGGVAVSPVGWQSFSDPVLAQLQARAVQANPDLQTAVLRFAQSRAQGQAVRSQGMPQLNASGSALRLRESEDGDFARVIGAINPASKDAVVKVLSEPHDMFQAGFDASWELDLWGRVRRSIEASDADEAAARAMLAQVQLSVQAEVARRYFELRSTQTQIRIARADILAGEETRSLVQARTSGGLTTGLDLSRQDAQLADVRARLPQLLGREAQAINQITLLLGVRPGALASELAPQMPAQAAALPDLSLGLPSEVALRRPDIQRAQAQLHAATAGIGVAVADLYPRITIGARFGFESVDASTFGEWGSRAWSIGPSLQLPIFDGGRRRATVTLRKLQEQEAAVAYQQTVLKAWHEIDDALSAYTSERQRNVQLAAMEVASRDAWDLARVRYEHGMTDFLVALDAQRTLLQAQRAHADSNARLALNLVVVAKALGVQPAPAA